MNGSAQNVDPRKKRNHATPAVAPITRAIRAALAVSATALALSSPVVSLAGTGSYGAIGNTYACNDAFSQTLPDASLVPPVDLTVVPGDQLPTSVNPATALAGIDAVCAGDVSAIAYVGTSNVWGNIDTSDAVDALDVSNVDEVTLVGGGDAFADVIGANAFSLSSDISIGNQADGTPAPGYGTLDIDNEGVINTDAAVDGANGIIATAVDSLTTIDNGSDISVIGYGNVFGIDVFDAYSASLNNSADISAEAGVGAGYFGTGAYATGARVNAMDAAVSNHGGISATATADGYYARAKAVDSFGHSGGSTVYNAGDIQGSAQADGGVARAFGVYSFGYATSSTVDNAGDIHASARADGGRAYASAINSIAYGYSGGRDTSISNSGALSADADAGIAYAITVFNIATGRYGNAYVTNADDGTIYAEANGDFTTATAVINQATRYGSAVTSNAGGIDATANGTSGGAAFGVSNYSQGYVATVDNSGSISATSTAAGIAMATGVENESALYSAYFHNSGSISASADSDAGMAAAWGVLDQSGQVSDITNDVGGVIEVVASSQDGYALAVGAYAIGGNAATLTNYGTISARSSSVNGDATAYAAVVNGGYAGIGLLINGGDLNANASSAAGDASASGAFVYGDVATIFNDGNTTATATAGGEAAASGLGVYGGYSAIYSYGDVTATAGSSTADGTATAIGADSLGYSGSSFYNAGDIHATASASTDGGSATATGASSIGYVFSAYATNVGAITAAATGEEATATGLLNASAFIGDAITTNSGDISVFAEGVMSATAVGAYNFAYAYDSLVDNSGSIQATAITTYYKAAAIGAQAVGFYGYGDASVINSGSIGASANAVDVVGYAAAHAWGAVSQNGPTGLAEIQNDGSISADAYASADFSFISATGAYVTSVAGTAAVVNRGDISASSHIGTHRGYAYATGAQAISNYSDSEAAVRNYGSVESKATAYSGFAISTGAKAYAYHASVTNAAGASIAATAYTDLFGSASALAVDAGGKYNVDVVNDGSITAYAHAAQGYYNPATGSTHFGVSGAIGIYTSAGSPFMPGDASVVNNGDITAIAVAENGITFFNAGAGASGIRALATYDAIVENAGNITAIADSELGIVGAYGAVANGRHDSQIVNHAGASIIASASVGTLASDYYAGRAATMGAEIFGAQHGYIHNAGSIISHAVVTPDGGANPGRSIASAFGVEMRTHDTGLLVNTGDIHAEASADYGYASAYGVRMPGNSLSNYSNNNAVTIDNAGTITARADADYGNAFAVGAYAYAAHSEYQGCGPGGCYYDVTGGESMVDNRGDILAVASAHGGVGYSYGSVSLGAFAAGITNAGHISAMTDADDARAVGGLVNSVYGDALLQNSGVISAVASGDIADASGAVVLGTYRVRIDNTGTIVAAAYGADATATAVSMESNGSNVLTNTGAIGAFGDGTRVAVWSGSSATASIANSGSITGAILTGDLDDNLDNADGAIWHAVGESDFGAGDDHIVNHGTILMDDAAIRLGGYVNGNMFDNFGTLAVAGAGNVLDMDNRFPVNNNGVISFVDGAADDMLTIVGDFAGQGRINVDVSGLSQSGDRLYIDGSVIEPTTQTLNVNLVNLPNTASMDVPLVYVRGHSTTGNFVLGNVTYDADGFVSLDFSLNSSIDASNAADDVLSLGVEVTGLNDLGSLAAALAPGAQRLVNAQIGTWRQRMGVVPEQNSGVLAPWMRMFSDSGDVAPKHSSNFGPGGDFGFDQSNHGWELGLDTRPSEHLALGVLIGASEGSQHLSEGGGSNRLDGRTFGLYGTWLSGNGFYLDASQRWTGVDARLRTATGTYTTEVSADSFNVEAGFTAWTMAGIHVVPQMQYTHTRVGDVSRLYGTGTQSTFVDEGGVSSRGRLGVAFDKTFEGAGFTWTPYGSVNAVREFDGEYDYSINGGLQGMTSTEGTSAMVELGLGARRDTLSVTAGVNWIDGGSLQSVTGGQLVMRYGW